jgi:fatty-acid peroxygenase
MPLPPRDLWPDATLPLLADPYRFASRRARALRSDIFRTRLLGRPAVFLTGPEAAAFFYAPGVFTREGAMPERIAQVLFGKGGVQRLEGPPHRHRKGLWLALMTDDALDRLGRAVERAWDEAIPELSATEEVDVFLHAARVLTVAVCRWAGVPLDPRFADETSVMLSSMFLHAAAVGPEHRRGRMNRGRAQDWAARLVLAARHGRVPPEGSLLGRLAAWTDPDGTPLAAEAAATELLSLLRPTVATAVYTCFVAMALHRHPRHREAVAADPAFRHAFVQEVRRLSPFFPVLAARPVADTAFRGASIPAGTRTILDLYGTCRHPAAWEAPGRFRPERFLRGAGDPWSMIPQGGGAHAGTHRCAGEWMTQRIMEVLACRLAGASYRVVTPEVRPNYRTAPALPKGGFLITEVRAG